MYPQTLYHYTSIEAFRSIIVNKQLWMTNIKYLNDSSELVHGIDIALAVILKHLEIHDKSNNFLSGFITRSLTADTLSKMRMSSCVASFSEDADSLSQWRAYASGGTGVCIGFKSEFFSNLIKAHPQTSERLVKCLYGSDQKESFVKELIQDELARLVTLSDSRGNLRDVTSTIGSIFGKLVIDGPVLKDVAFHSENEWRFVMPTNEDQTSGFATPDWQFRSTKTSLVPYMLLNLLEGEGGGPKIATIHIGPSPHSHLTKRSVEMFLRGQQVEFEEVIGSTAPFRVW